MKGLRIRGKVVGAGNAPSTHTIGMLIWVSVCLHAMSTNTDKDNRANQLNPNNPRYAGTADKASLNNRSNQLNPNNPRYAGGKSDKK